MSGSRSMRRAALTIAVLSTCGSAWADPPAEGSNLHASESLVPDAALVPLLSRDDAVRGAAIAAWDSSRAEASGRARGATRLLAQALRGSDVPAVRAAAAKSLGALLLPAGADLTAALADEDAEVRLAATRALTRLRASHARRPECLPAMAERLDDDDPRVRAAALDGIAAYGSRELLAGETAAPMLGRVLAASADPAAADVRRAALLALHALAGLEGRPEVSRAFAAALSDADGGVRATAARAFAGVARAARRRDRWAVDRDPLTAAALAAEDAVMEEAAPLLARLLDDPDPATRTIAAYAYWEAGGATSEVLPVVVESMRGAHGAALIAPLSVIAEMGPDAQAATEAVLATLGEDTFLRGLGDGRETMDALLAIGPPVPVALPAIERILAQGSPAARRAAAGALPALDAGHEADARSCARAAAAALEREADPAVRGALLESLGAIGVGGDLLVRRLVAALDASESERRGALRGLGRLGSRAAAAVRALENAAREGGTLQETAAWALGRVGGAGSAARALPLVKDMALRLDLVRVLEAAGPGDAVSVPALVAALPGAPAEVAGALGRIGPAAAGAAPALVRLTAAPMARTRIAAAQALLLVGEETQVARDVLVAALSTDPSLCDDARLAAYAVGRAGVSDAKTEAALRAAFDERHASAAGVAFALAATTGETEPWLDAMLSAVARAYPAPDRDLVDSLGELGPAAARAVPALEHQALVWSRESGARGAYVEASRAAIRALGRIGPAANESGPTLRALARNALFREEATEALRRVAGR